MLIQFSIFIFLCFTHNFFAVNTQSFLGNEFDECVNFDEICPEIFDEDEVECFADTKLGNVIGLELKTVFEDGSFCAYRGIPYAKAPIGALRFKVKFFVVFHLNRNEIKSEWIKALRIELI